LITERELIVTSLLEINLTDRVVWSFHCDVMAAIGWSPKVMEAVGSL
jgi:hypothetical protein